MTINKLYKIISDKPQLIKEADDNCTLLCIKGDNVTEHFYPASRLTLSEPIDYFEKKTKLNTQVSPSLSECKCDFYTTLFVNGCQCGGI